MKTDVVFFKVGFKWKLMNFILNKKNLLKWRNIFKGQDERKREFNEKSIKVFINKHIIMINKVNLLNIKEFDEKYSNDVLSQFMSAKIGAIKNK